MRVTSAIALMMLALLAVAAAPAAAAPTGLVRGTSPPQSGPLAKKIPPRVLAVRLIPRGDQEATFARPGRPWSLRLSPGVWAVVTTTSTRAGQRRTARLVRVRARRTSTIPRAASLHAGGGARVSVGTITGPGGSGPAIRSMLVTDLVQEGDSAPCDYGVVVDPRDPDYRAIRDELRLNTTKYFPDATRRAAQRALAQEAALRPQYRVEGSVTQLGEQLRGPSSGTIRLVQAATGQVIWEERISLGDAGSQAFMQLVAKSLTRAICDIPAAFTGTGQADITEANSGLRYEWNGPMAFVLSDGGEQADGTFRFRYALTSLTLQSARASTPPTTSCSEISGTFAGTPEVSGGNLELTIHADGSRTYELGVGVTTPSITMTGTCNDDPVSFPIQMGAGLTSKASEPWLGPTLAGTYTGGWPRPDLIGGIPAFNMTGSWVLQPLRDG